MAARLRTSRGIYLLSATGEPARSERGIVLGLALQSADGIERVAFRCSIARESFGAEAVDRMVELLAPWVEGQFEQLREAALKSLRSEGKLLEVAFDPAEGR